MKRHISVAVICFALFTWACSSNEPSAEPADEPVAASIAETAPPPAPADDKPASVKLPGKPVASQIPESEVNGDLKAFAQKWVLDLIEKQEAGKFEPLGDEAIPQMREALTPELQKTGHAQKAAMFGAFQSLSYHSTWKVEGVPHTIFRFKGKHEKEEPEVRVVVDEKGKISGLWFKPWMNQLN